MKPWVAALLLIFPVYCYSVTYPSELHSDLHAYEIRSHNGLPFIAWPLSSDRYYCVAWGPGAIQPSGVGEGETFTRYLLRSTRRFIVRDLDPGEQALCNQIERENSIVWRVQQVGETVYRPLYHREGFSTSTKQEMGVVDVNIPCGAHVAPVSARIKSLEWREVGGGVAVCKRE